MVMNVRIASSSQVCGSKKLTAWFPTRVQDSYKKKPLRGDFATDGDHPNPVSVAPSGGALNGNRKPGRSHPHPSEEMN